MNSIRELHAMLILYRAATPEAQAEARRMLPDLGELIDLVGDVRQLQINTEKKPDIVSRFITLQDHHIARFR
jgi:hypothetical protein